MQRAGEQQRQYTSEERQAKKTPASILALGDNDESWMMAAPMSLSLSLSLYISILAPMRPALSLGNETKAGEVQAASVASIFSGDGVFFFFFGIGTQALDMAAAVRI